MFKARPAPKRGGYKVPASTVAALARTIQEALVDDLSPDSWQAVVRALEYGSMQLVEDLIVGSGESLTRAWSDRFVLALGGAYETIANAELAKTRSGMRVVLFQKAKWKSPIDPTRNRFTSVPHNDTFIRQQAASLIVRVSRDQRQAIREQLMARYSRERRPETLIRDLKLTVGLDPRRTRALRNYEDKLRESGAKNVAAMVDRYRKDLLQSRAETIARTESSAIENRAKQEAWSIAADEGAIPSDAEQEWVAHEDACPTCDELDGMRVAVGDTFPGGLAGPPAHPSCFCGLVLRSF